MKSSPGEFIAHAARPRESWRQLWSTGLLVVVVIPGLVLVISRLVWAQALYHRVDKHDEYVVGNGRMYVVAALGKELTRKGTSVLTKTPAPLTQIAWVTGPMYGNADLGFGWQVIAEVDGQPAPWTDERVLRPTSSLPF